MAVWQQEDVRRQASIIGLKFEQIRCYKQIFANKMTVEGKRLDMIGLHGEFLFYCVQLKDIKKKKRFPRAQFGPNYAFFVSKIQKALFF